MYGVAGGVEECVQKRLEWFWTQPNIQKCPKSSQLIHGLMVINSHAILSLFLQTTVKRVLQRLYYFAVCRNLGVKPEEVPTTNTFRGLGWFPLGDRLHAPVAHNGCIINL